MRLSKKNNISKFNPFISIVIPAYNENKGIANTVKEMDAQLRSDGNEYEIIVVDDGSNDGTFEKLQYLSQRHSALKAIRLSRNFGKEAAIYNGLKACSGDAVITMDADLQHPPKTITALLEKWRQGYAVVHAVKRERSCDNFWVRLRASLFNRVIKILGEVNLTNASDFILMDRCVKDVIVDQLKENNRFYRGLARWVGFSQATVYFDVAERWDQSLSRFSLASLVNLAATALVAFTTTPLRIVSILGLASFLMGAVIGVDALISWCMDKAVSGYTTIILTLLLMGSFIMISLGIIGEYIGKIYEETKGRPTGVVEFSFGFEIEKQFEELRKNVGLPMEQNQDNMVH